MDEKYLSELMAMYNNDFSKYAIVFLGGMITGYAIKKTIDSMDFENIRKNASNMLNDRFNHEIKYVEDELEPVEEVVVDIE